MNRPPLRMPWPAMLLGVAVAAVGVAGLVTGAAPWSGTAAASDAGPSPSIVVSGAYVRPPVPPTPTAAAYFTIYNTSHTSDVLQSVTTDAGSSAVLHAVVGGAMQVPVAGVPVPAGGGFALSTGNGHVMISGLYGTLRAGAQVSLQLQFAHAGSVSVSAVVVPFGEQPPSPSPPPAGISSVVPQPVPTVPVSAGAPTPTAASSGAPEPGSRGSGSAPSDAAPSTAARSVPAPVSSGRSAQSSSTSSGATP